MWNCLSPEIMEMELNNFKRAVEGFWDFPFFLADKVPGLIKNVTSVFSEIAAQAGIVAHTQG